MELSERQYDRIARRLDGEAVDLSAAERAAVEDIHSLEALLGGALGVEVPRGAMARAERRVTAELARPRRRALRFATAGAAAAAAMIAIVLWSAFPPTQTSVHTPVVGIAAIMLSEDFLQPPDDRPDAELALLTTQVEQLETELLVGPPAPADDAELKAMEREVDEFWLNESP